MDRILHKVDFGFLWWCPACGCCHGAWTNKKNELTGAGWTWDGNEEKPTFSPSFLVRADSWDPPVTPENIQQWRQTPWPQTLKPRVCHTYVRNGMIQYLGDCTHAMAGQTVPMEKF